MLTPSDSAYRELRLLSCIIAGLLAVAIWLDWLDIAWYWPLVALGLPPLLVITLAYVGAFICATADRMKRITI